MKNIHSLIWFYEFKIHGEKKEPFKVQSFVTSIKKTNSFIITLFSFFFESIVLLFQSKSFLEQEDLRFYLLPSGQTLRFLCKVLERWGIT